MNSFETQGSLRTAGDLSMLGFCRRMSSTKGMSSAPHQLGAPLQGLFHDAGNGPLIVDSGSVAGNLGLRDDGTEGR